MKKFFILLCSMILCMTSCYDDSELLERLDALENSTNTLFGQTSALEKSVQSLEAVNTEVKITLDELQKQIGANQTSISDLVKKDTEIDKQIEDLNKLGAGHSDFIAELEKRSDAIEIEISDIQKKIEVDSVSIFNLQEKDKNLEKGIEDLKKQLEKDVSDTKKWVEETYVTIEVYDTLSANLDSLKVKHGEDFKTLDKKIDDSVKDIKEWVNKTLESYYTSKEVDNLLTDLKDRLDVLEKKLNNLLRVFRIAFNESEIGIVPGGIKEVGYRIEGATRSTIVKAWGQNGWSARVNQQTDSTGVITVSAPDPVTDDEIIVVVYDGEYRTIMSSINFVKGVIVPSQESIGAPKEGGQYEITINTNLNYTVEIPEPDRNWVLLVPQTKSMRADKLTFSVSPNDGTMRKSVVSLKDEQGNSLQKINVLQEGPIATYPAPNQIYYSTRDNKPLEIDLNKLGASLGANVVLNEYYSSMGIITFDRNIKTIAGFGPYKSLTSITVPECVENIGDCSFYECYNLSRITIPNSITSIGYSAFWHCTQLTDITFPTSLKSIGAYAFDTCSSLVSIAIPDSVISVGDYAFNYCSGLTDIKFSNGMKDIPYCAFSDCTSLTKVTIPESVSHVRNLAFRSCSSLTTVTMSNSVTYIGNNAFEDCSSLVSIAVPEEVKNIGQYAFNLCSNLKEVYCKPVIVPFVDNESFSSCHPDQKIYVPIESVEEYKTDPNWSAYADRIVGYDYSSQE